MALSLTCKKFLRLYSSVKSKNFLRLYSNGSPQDRTGLVLGCYYDEDSKTLELTPSAEKYNEACKGKLLDNLKLAGNKVENGKCFLFWGLTEQYQAVAVVGLGKRNNCRNPIEFLCEEEETVRNAAAVACKSLDAAGIKQICVEGFGGYAEAAAEGSKLGVFTFQDYKTKKHVLPKINLYQSCPSDEEPWCRGSIKADAQNIARTLADTPANLLTPTIFAEKVHQILEKVKLKIDVHDHKWAGKENMCAFLAVAKGSLEEPKFLEITYGPGDDKPFVLVGKGVTFDAGGISLKPATNMHEMRGDMAGAACLIGAIHAIAVRNIDVDLKILIPLTENLPSGSAVKPGDVITARNGKTICVDNTDAEGRLILADALSYSEKFCPKWVMDIATLTGAMHVALGDSATGVFSNNNELYQKLQDASMLTGDRVWRMPLWNHFTNHITKNAAFDLNNISKVKGGGSCSAAAFLREFIPKDTKWMHLDIAGVFGTSDTSTKYLGKGMTGRPTRTIIEFIQAQSKKC